MSGPRRVALAVLVAAPLLASCDPCSGVVGGCRVDQRVSYGGKIIDFATGAGAPGVRVTFRRDSGGTLVTDSLTGVTDGAGRYQLAGDVSGPRDVFGTLTLRPPAPLVAYAIGGIKLIASETRGAGDLLPTYLTRPQIDFIAALRFRRPEVPFSYASVRFVRTGGARLIGGDTLRVDGGVDGFVYISGATLDTGDVIGDLAVASPSFAREYVVPGVRIPTRVTDRTPSLDRVIRVGAAAEYVAEIRARGSTRPLGDALVQFRRTGGLRLVVDTFSARTNADGRVALRPTLANELPGAVLGDLTVSGGGLERPFVIRGVRLPVYDDDQLRFLGVLGVGFQAVAAGELVFRGDRSPLAGADVRFERTGGLVATPSTWTTRSGDDGRFGVSLLTEATGEVVGDLFVTRIGESAPVVFRGVRIAATDDDSVRFAGRFSIGQQLLYAGQLVRRADGTGAAGWTVTFRRTGGIALRTETATAVSVDWGGFSIAPDTREQGVVEGQLTARAPGSTVDVPLGSVRLATFDGDEVRLAGQYRVGPSLLYVGELLRDDTDRPIVDARIEFRRTGGVAVAESLLVERSNADGRFRLAPTPLASGEVVGDLRIFPRAPLRDTVFTNVRLSTFDSDEVRLRDVWRLAPPR